SRAKKNGTTGKLGDDVRQELALDEQVTSLYVSGSGMRGSLDIIIASENKRIAIYGRDLTQPQYVIKPPQEVRVVSAHVTQKDDVPMIVAGTEGDIDHRVYAYTRSGTTPLWTYETKGRVEALRIHEVDDQGNIEVIVGSLDRNIHVLDQYGKLKWRYYLPNF